MRALTLPVALLCAQGCMGVRLPQARLGSFLADQDVSWEQAVDLALRSHPDLLEARANVLSKAHSRNSALGAYLPRVDGSYDRTHTRATAAGSATDSNSFNLEATQPLFTGFQTTGEYLQARREWEAARWSYQKTSADVRLRLRTAYADLLRQQTLEDATRRIADRRKENADMIQLLYKSGREHRGSLLLAQANADNAAFALRQAQRRTGTERLTLGRELGGQIWSNARIAEDPEKLVPAPPEPPTDYEALADQAPDVQKLVKDAEALKAQILSTQSNLWPTVEGTASYGYSGEHVSHMRDDAAVGIAVSVPLFAGGSNVQDVLAARQDYRAALQAARSGRDEKIVSLSTAWAAFRDAREFVDVRHKFLEAARERADIVRTQYQSGLASFQDFDTAEQGLADAETQYVDSLADVLIREAAWEDAKGSTLEDARHGR